MRKIKFKYYLLFYSMIVILLLYFNCTTPSSSGGGGGSKNTGPRDIWTWISGNDIRNQSGVYGTKGIAASTNIPGSRADSISWIDSSGNLWLFGGNGYDSTGVFGVLNDLWMYNGIIWTWISGSNVVGQIGVYGTKGVATPTNIPGSRYSSISWIDSSGNLWLFSGYGISSFLSYGRLNDLWMFDGTDWTWVSGSDDVNQTGIYGTQGIAADTNIPGGRQSSISWIDSSGNLWLFGGDGYDSTGVTGFLNDLWMFNGESWAWISGSNLVDQLGVYGTISEPASSNIPGSRGLSISWIDTSDNLWLFGGLGYDSVNLTYGYLNDLWRYDGENWTWISGSNVVDQLGVYGTQGIAADTNIPGSRYDSISWIDSSGNLWLFGGYGYDSTWRFLLNDLWRYDGTNWVWISGSDIGDQTGVYGTKGIADTANIPGSRRSCINWMDPSGNLWLFSGLGNDSTGNDDYLNDLWRYRP